MPLSSNPNNFPDVKRVLDTALATPGGILYQPLNSAGEASRGWSIHWMQRANHFRLLLQKRSAALHPDTEFGSSPYDQLKLRLSCGCYKGCKRPGETCGGTTVIISEAEQETIGVVMDRRGNPISLAPAATAKVEDIGADMEEALRIKKEMGL